MDHRQRRNRHIPGANPSLAPHQRTLTAAAVALTRVCSNGSQGAAPWASRAASALSRLPSLAHNLSLTTHTYSSATQPPAVPEGSSVVNSVRGATALWGPQNPATALAGKMPFVCTLRITDCGDRHEPSDHSSHTCLLTYATYVFTHSNTPTVIAGTTATGTGGAGGGGGMGLWSTPTPNRAEGFTRPSMLRPAPTTPQSKAHGLRQVIRTSTRALPQQASHGYRQAHTVTAEQGKREDSHPSVA